VRAHGTWRFGISTEMGLKRNVRIHLSDGDEELAFLDICATLVESGQEPSWYGRVGRFLGQRKGSAMSLYKILLFTTKSRFPQVAILWNIAETLSVSTKLAGLQGGPTRRKWSYKDVNDHSVDNNSNYSEGIDPFDSNSRD